MAALSPIVSVLLGIVTLFSIVAISDSTPVTQRLRLMSGYSEEEVKGCYEYNKTLGVCFDVKKGSMKIQKTIGEVIVYYEELGPGMFFYQVLEQAFVGNTPTMFYVPGEVPKEPEVLRAFLKFIKYKNSKEQREALKTHFLKAMSELHDIPEVQLLELVSAALSDNSTRLEIVKPFHVLCFFLLKQSNVEIPSELRAELHMEDKTTDQHDREKRCTSLKSDPYSNTCEGMCGPRCWCWSIICGNCCWNRGCYQHDRCCEHDWFSTYCLLPVGFSCSRYKGYPRCLTSPWPWK